MNDWHLTYILSLWTEEKGKSAARELFLDRSTYAEDYEFYIAIRVLLKSLAMLDAEANLVVIASLDVPPRWIRALMVSNISEEIVLTDFSHTSTWILLLRVGVVNALSVLRVPPLSASVHYTHNTSSYRVNDVGADEADGWRSGVRRKFLKLENFS
ncbi:hypothetical protein JHK82_016093 [Glycine max]|nr:hypothetical protein JHK82_016093 [Glycine max]